MTTEAPAGSRGRRLVATVRFRVTALAALAVLLALVATGAGLVVAQQRLLRHGLEEAMSQRADQLAAALARGQVPVEPTGGIDDNDAVQVVDADGRVVAASPNLAGEPAIVDPPPSGRTQALRTTDDLPVDDHAFRVLSRRVPGPDGTSVIHLASNLDDVDESTRVLAASLTAAVPLVTLLLAGLIWWLVGRTLRPVEAIRSEVADIGGSDLHRRVPEPGSGDEIDRLARTMNAMLDRVEDAARRQQRFVADASHELRSPLTRIRSEIEVDLAHPEGADPAATHRSVLEEAVALQGLVDDLLHLARSDAGAITTKAEAVDLDDIVLRHARRLSAGGRVDVDGTAISAAQVRGHRHQLGRAVGNLVDNAARHAATTVTFTLAERDHVAVLTVADDGPGIPPHQRERVFERFTRLDDARHSTTGGTGLGLAIARDIIERHGGTIAVDPDHAGGARLVVTLPLASDGDGDRDLRGRRPGSREPAGR